MHTPTELPRWIDLGVLPLVNLILASLVCGVVVALAGQDPGQVIVLLVKGAFGSPVGLSYTLYYATTFIFTGLAVAVAFHAGLFNIGGEGQAMIGGLGAGMVALAFPDSASAWLVLPAMVLAAAAAGLLWAAVPGALQAWRGSHIVITTIMFNFIASALLAWVLVNVLREPGNMTVESRAFPPGARMPGAHEALAWLGWSWPTTPLNLTVLLALAAALAVYLLLWRSRPGYELRVAGQAPEAAHYAGIRPRGRVMLAMMCSGALAGLVGVNELAGVHGRLLLDYVVGAGFTGIAVSLIGRNHPVGVVLAAVLFGAVYQGGAELAFEIPGFSRDMVTTLQGLIVVFAGGMAMVTAAWAGRAYHALKMPSKAASVPTAVSEPSVHG